MWKIKSSNSCLLTLWSLLTSETAEHDEEFCSICQQLAIGLENTISTILDSCFFSQAAAESYPQETFVLALA